MEFVSGVIKDVAGNDYAGIDGIMDTFNFATGTTPITIDLNGNGLDFIPLDKSTAHFDMNNDGHTDRTAWVGADDGILAIDLNGDKMITDKSEFVFTDHAPEAKLTWKLCRLHLTQTEINI